MATADYIISNQSGASFRTDLNNTLAAIVSNNSSSSQPSTRYAYQWWADTTNGILKIRNSANNAWINLFSLAGGIDVDAASNFAAAVTFTDNVTFDGATAGRDIVFDRSANSLDFADNAKAKFGAGAGGVGDLEIYHTGSSSLIADEGTGGITISTGLLTFMNQARDETLATFAVNGACTLFFDNAQKFITKSDGVDITGEVQCDSLDVDGNTVISGSLKSDNSGDMFIDHGTTGQDIRFRTSVSSALDTDSVKITSVGNIAFASGKGLDFSATGDASSGGTSDSEIFDDYEEGDYVPSFTVNSGSVTLASDHNTLSYTKIGRLVFIYGQLKVSSVSSPSGIFRAVLPFAQANQTEQAERTMGNIFVENAAVNNIGDFSTFPNGGVDSFIEIVSTTGTAVTRNGGQNMQADTQIIVQMSYISN